MGADPHRYLRLDPPTMRAVARDLDAEAEASRRLSRTVPTLADGYDLPPAVAAQARAELAGIGMELGWAGARVQDLGADVRARATLAELADRDDAPDGLRDRIRHVADAFDCPLDDPVRRLIHDANAAAATGAAISVQPLAEALHTLVDDAAATHLRNELNEHAGTCLPNLPTLPPPSEPPTPPPAPAPGPAPAPAPAAHHGFFDRVVHGIRDAPGTVSHAMGGAAGTVRHAVGDGAGTVGHTVSGAAETVGGGAHAVEKVVVNGARDFDHATDTAAQAVDHALQDASDALQNLPQPGENPFPGGPSLPPIPLAPA
jgi:hypothetical protein